MTRIPNEVINEIRQKARIEDIISQYIEVIHKGNSYVAVCPFHDDHDPSLHISPSKQIFKCFVCDSAGDVFSFVQKYEGISYVQAIRKVADLIGYKYDFGSEYEQPVFQETEVHKIMRESVTFCQHELNSEAGQKAKQYLLNRGLAQEQLERFQFGYNPPRNMLYGFLSRKGYQDKDIIQANVGRLTENGVADVFYDRITIPIHDREGHPIGFTARSMDPHAESKYINSTDTPVYHKSEVLFNYHRAVNQIRRDKYVILAEGPMDVMAFDAAGLSNAVCSLGTSCTKEQLQQLKKLTGTILMAYDGDKAGQNAIYRGGLLARQNGFRVLIINNDTDLDPDEIIHKYGREKLQEMIVKPKTWMEFVFSYFRRQYDLTNYSSRKEFASKVMAEINQLTDNFDRDNYLDQLSQLTGFAVGTLADNMSAQQTVPQPQVARRDPERYRPWIMDGETLAERTVLKQMLMSRKMCDLYKSELKYLRDRQANTLALHVID
ncbi:MAG: DNA primase, partial [Erysipelotrichaceae bacterium]|nr:DNA primase [Erysipelotrichaceae bacterium]